MVQLKHSHSPSAGVSPTYRSWDHMIQRCVNPNNHAYKWYGGRGITVCERWQDFRAFLADMGERPLHTSLDRYPDNNGNYEPGNCRWATREQQMINTRAIRHAEINGETLSFHEICARYKIKYKTLIRRVDGHGMSLDAAVTLPVVKGKHHVRDRQSPDGVRRMPPKSVLAPAMEVSQTKAS